MARDEGPSVRRVVFWVRSAARRFGRILADVEESRGEDAANKVKWEVDHQVANLAYFPDLGRPGRVARTRELIINRTGLIVAYRDNEADGRIEILYIAHGKEQDWPQRF